MSFKIEIPMTTYMRNSSMGSLVKPEHAGQTKVVGGATTEESAEEISAIMGNIYGCEATVVSN